LGLKYYNLPHNVDLVKLKEKEKEKEKGKYQALHCDPG
jgi:hypothetical protein